MVAGRHAKRVAATACAALIIFLLGKFGVLSFVIRPISAGVAAIASVFYGAGTHAMQTLAGRADANDIAIDALQRENARLRLLTVETEALKHALEYREKSKSQSVLARVISTAPDDAIHALIIDQGADTGLSIGQPVVAGDGVIIGKIFDVRDFSSTVLLLSDSQSRLAVTVESALETLGVLEGDRGLSMRISLIPQSERLIAGDPVITSGIEPGVRRGLLVGTIDGIEKHTHDPFQTATVVPFLDGRHPLFVQVLREDSAP